MTTNRDVLVYGASGYTGKLVAEYLAARDIPFYMAGRDTARLEAARAVVEQRIGRSIDASLDTADNTVESLLPLFQRVKVVINVVGPFMQLAWPVVEAALQAGCHYIDTTGEQDWTIAVADKFGAAFAEKKLLLCPATSYMWAAGALAAEVLLEDPGIDSLDILYQIDNGLPSQASTKSFLRMICNETSQFYLEQNQYRNWPLDVMHDVFVPYRAIKMSAHPWGGGCEPVWFKDDPRVRNCRVLTQLADHLRGGIMQALRAPRSVDQRGRRKDDGSRAAQGRSRRAAQRHRLPRPGPPGDTHLLPQHVGAVQLDRRSVRGSSAATAAWTAPGRGLPVTGTRLRSSRAARRVPSARLLQPAGVRERP